MEEPQAAIVVGLDGREHDSDVLQLARTLKESLGGQLILVHVIPPPSIAEGEAEYARQARRDGRQLLERAADEMGSLTQTRVLEQWPAASALAQIAADRNATMLVAGSSHRGAAGRILPGSVVLRLLSRAPCPIAVAPVDYGQRGGQSVSKVGVAYDATHESDIALKVAAQAAARLAVPLQLYHAMHAISDDPAWDKFRQHMTEYVSRMLDHGLKQLPPELAATGHVLEGDVGTALAQAVVEDDIGLLYMGSRGYGPLREALLGGAASALLQTVRCPLVIVPCESPPRVADESPLGRSDRRLRARA